MWHKVIPTDALKGGRPWNVDQFLDDISGSAAVCGATAIRSVVEVRDESVSPLAEPYRDLPYIGLDAVESGTGELQRILTASEQSITSRSKTFRSGDVLYGRLRAYLNKVAFIGENIPRGSCSGEFYVLKAKESIEPRFLQWVLQSDAAVKYVTNRLAGATHPRLNLEDLLEFRIELPAIELQRKAVQLIEAAQTRRCELQSELQSLRGKVAAAIDTILTQAN